MSRYLFTSESVSEGHPDKLCDQVSDAVLDAAITEDPKSRVACETLCKTGFVVVAGEITTQAKSLDFGKSREASLPTSATPILPWVSMPRLVPC